MQNHDLNNIYTTEKGIIPKSVLTRKNKARTWLYGYNEKYDIIIISKSGQIGEIINISGLKVALHLATNNISKRSSKKE